MDDDTDRALLAVLDDTADQDVPGDARQAAERDIAALRRGMTLLAADTPPAPVTVPVPTRHPAPVRRPARRRFDRRLLAVAAGLTVFAAALAVVPGLLRHNSPATTVPAPTVDLRGQVAAAERIIVGTVSKVDRGRLAGPAEAEPGDRYVLATVGVSEVIKGPGEGQVVAFSYDRDAATTSEGATRPWHVGDRVLLFLVSDAGTVSADLSPPHLQVAGGEAGRYLIRNGEPDGAGFTLDEVRRAAG